MNEGDLFALILTGECHLNVLLTLTQTMPDRSWITRVPQSVILHLLFNVPFRTDVLSPKELVGLMMNSRELMVRIVKWHCEVFGG